MVNNPEEGKNLLGEVIVALQNELIEQRQAVAKAIGIQNEQAKLVETLKQNLVDLETKIARFQAMYDQFND